MTRQPVEDLMSEILKRSEPAPNPLRLAFLRWQCRVRQIMMREHQGRPSDGIMPAVTLPGESEPMGHVITVMFKSGRHSITPEMQHMVRSTNDPAQRRDKALRLFSEFHFQKPDQFSDMLTATFPPGSPGAARIRAAERVTLSFEAYNQRFDIEARVWQLAEKNPAWQATYWHNLLFNPALPPDTVILGFEPDWSRSSADPSPV